LFNKISIALLRLFIVNQIPLNIIKQESGYTWIYNKFIYIYI